MASAQLGAIRHQCPRASGSASDDAQLLQQFTDEREDAAEAAFAALIRRHGPMVLRVCHQILGDRHDAEDAFQASFLVLARRARSIRQPALLGNWLYGVALRTAKEVKMRSGRRRRLEAALELADDRHDLGDPGQPALGLIRREELAALHEELARLPDRLRIPMVLCELQGLTYQEAARRLDCPVSTIGVRLGRARAHLRQRLIRRGIAPASVMAAALYGSEEVVALVSAALVDSTARAATLFAAGDAAAKGLVPAAVLVLTGATLKIMKVTAAQAVTAAVLVGGLAAGFGLASQPWFARTAPASRTASRSAAEPSRVAPIGAEVGPDRAGAEAGRPAPRTPPPPVPVAAAASPPLDPAVSSAPAPAPIRADASATPAGDCRAAVRERPRGEALFFKEWVVNDPGSHGGDGLGPVYNETSCVACHNLGAPGGAGPETKNVLLLTARAAAKREARQGLERIHPGLRDTLSTVIHRYGTDPGYRSWRNELLTGRFDTNREAGPETVAARIARIAAQTTPQSRSQQRSLAINTNSGIGLRVSERNSPPLFGVGQIDAIPPAVLVEQAREQDAEVRGRVSQLRDGHVGRLGWKGQIANLHDFVRRACASELGLEVPGHSQAPSPLMPSEQPRGLDLTEPDCNALVTFVRDFPPPLVVDPSGPHGSSDTSAGRRLFAAVGCASCHAPSLGAVRGIYSDLLLHDLGPILSDSGSYYEPEGPRSPGDPSPEEWRTPPLWGFRDSGPYLHDGRAENLEEAVAAHGGQAGRSTHQFFSLTADEQALIESFLKALVVPGSTPTPGLILAADFEAQVEPEAVRRTEALVRQRRVAMEAAEAARKAEVQRRQQAEAAAKVATGRLQMAANLEKAGKLSGALEFYRLIARDTPNSTPGRLAVDKIGSIDRVPRQP